ncbi:MAG: glycosyltransferase family 4 protein [Ignavibacteria bacterium]|nr:glycosyltransferase family 4 protein [Ignavibacteria bacterium]
MKNILYITNELNSLDGVTNHLYFLVKELSGLYKGKIYVIAGGGNNLSLFDSVHCELIINPLFRHQDRNILNFTKAIKYVTGFAKRNNIGIIHSHNHYAANIAYYSSKFTGARTIQTNHGLFPSAGRLKHFKADHHIVLNRRIFDYLESEIGIDRKRIKLIKPGFIYERGSKTEKDKRLFFSASRYSREKSLNTYIEAAGLMNLSFPDEYKFCISGEGEEEKTLRKINSRSGGSVTFFDGRKDYHELLSKAAVFVFSSAALEGLPTVLLEAVAADCLVISSSYKGIEDLFPEPYDKLLFKAGDVRGLSGRMQYASEHYEELRKQFAPLYLKINEEYSLDNMIRRHLELYRELSGR